jgi:predicted transcriptional regulator
LERFGFIHEKLDIKILILFILRRLPAAVSAETLTELIFCDEGIGYFDYAESLAELVETGHVQQKEDGYLLTEKGDRNGETLEDSIPYSVRVKAEEKLAPVAEAMRRAAMIEAKHSMQEDGCRVELGLSDGLGDIARLCLLCAGEEQAERIERNFRADAEGIYHRIMEMLSGSGETKEKEPRS